MSTHGAIELGILVFMVVFVVGFAVYSEWNARRDAERIYEDIAKHVAYRRYAENVITTRECAYCQYPALIALPRDKDKEPVCQLCRANGVKPKEIIG